MYIRFVSAAIDQDSRKPRGVFVEAHELLNRGDVTKQEWTELRSHLDWFNANLPPPPERFTASRAIFWFRNDAVECINKVWSLVQLLRSHNIHITIQKCRHLRNIVYADKVQVASYPHPLDDRIIDH